MFDGQHPAEIAAHSLECRSRACGSMFDLRQIHRVVTKIMIVYYFVRTTIQATADKADKYSSDDICACV
jgi:hypothetical protein